MRIQLVLPALFVAIAFVAAVSFAGDAPYAGKFSDGTLGIELSQQGSGYSGSITRGQQTFPAVAHLDGSALIGTFDSAGHSYPFTATLANDTLTLKTGTKTYELKSLATIPANPLSNNAPSNSAQTGSVASTSNATPSANVPPGYEVTASTAVGQSLLTRKPSLTSVKAALEATFPELAQFFGSRPVIGKAFQDAKDSNSGGATFTVSFHGQPMQGFVKCDLDKTGATVAVIYGQTNAPKSDWDKLLKPPAPATAPGGNGALAVSEPAVALKQYVFPDGTGSVGLVDGWTTKTQSAADGLFVLGPANQVLVMNNGILINLPDSQAVKNRDNMRQMMKQLEDRRVAMAKSFERQFGRPSPLANPPPAPPPAPPLLVAPLLDPVEALKALSPQFSAFAQFQHGPAFELDRIISSKDLPTPLQGGKSAEILYEATTTADGKPIHLRRLLRVTTSPMGTAVWFWYVSSGMAAPVETFDHDLPLMQAMARSVKVDQQRLNDVEQQRNQQMQQAGQAMTDATNHAMKIQHDMFEDNLRTQSDIHNQQMQQTQDSFARHNAQWSNDEWQKQRSAANFQEYILGSRTVYDTKTGQSTSVDLSYANGVAQSLNDATLDPNRFVAIPLRDQLYPTPPPVPGR